MKLGLVSKYKVERETNLGYMISDVTGEYFLHHNECYGGYFKTGEIVNAFLYIDKQRRVAATLADPLVTLDKGGLCEVVGQNDAGVFVNIGISRDILLSSDDLETDKWPEVGDKVCCNLKVRGKNIFIRLLNKPEILEMDNNEILEAGNKYIGYVYRISEKGINLVTNGYQIIFVYYKHLRKSYRLGEAVEVKIIDANDNDYNGTLIEQKEIMIKDDAKTIMDYLETHNGVMNYTSNSSPEIIYNVFKMSKSSFKRALGNLYKDKIVTLNDDKTIMIDYLNK